MRSDNFVEMAFGTLFFGLGIFAAFAAIVCGLHEISKYRYCKLQGVPYGVCNSYLKEEFATSNVKIRVKNEQC